MTFVQANEVPAVQRQHDSVASGREIDDLSIGDRLIRLARFVSGQDIMAEAPQGFDNVGRKFSSA